MTIYRIIWHASSPQHYGKVWKSIHMITDENVVYVQL